MEPDKPRAADAELRKAVATILKEQPGLAGSRERPRRLVRGRQAHRASLEAWAMVFKGLALVWWAAGVIVIVAHVVAVTRAQRLLAESMKDVPSHLIGPSVLIGIVVVLVTAFAAGAVSWAISLALVSLGHIEENTRLAAGAEEEQWLPSPPDSPRHPPPYLGRDA